jgi:hypothetical protein
MKTASMVGSLIVTIALVFYSIGYTKEKRRQMVTSRVLLYYTMGLTLDITATIFMIIGSSKGMLTVHGFIGYSSLLGMLADTFIFWRHFLKQGSEKIVSRRVQLYSRIAYSWWVIAYITGGLLVAIAKIFR